MGREYRKTLIFTDEEQCDRFTELRRDAEERIGCDYLSNDQFAILLMDVYRHHLESDPGPLSRTFELVEGNRINNEIAVMVDGGDL